MSPGIYTQGSVLYVSPYSPYIAHGSSLPRGAAVRLPRALFEIKAFGCASEVSRASRGKSDIKLRLLRRFFEKVRLVYKCQDDSARLRFGCDLLPVDRINQIFPGEGFAEIAVEALFDVSFPLAGQGVCGEGDDVKVFVFPVCAEVF